MPSTPKFYYRKSVLWGLLFWKPDNRCFFQLILIFLMYTCNIKVKKSMDFLLWVGKTRKTLCDTSAYFRFCWRRNRKIWLRIFLSWDRNFSIPGIESFMSLKLNFFQDKSQKISISSKSSPLFCEMLHHWIQISFSGHPFISKEPDL